MKNRSITVNLISAFFANGVGLTVSAVASFLVPRFLGDADYGFWQLFVFYASYVGLFHFGLQDGIYLRFGGKHYEGLDKPLFHTEFLALLGTEVLIAAAIVFGAQLFVQDPNRQLVLCLFGCLCIIYLPSSLLQYIMQTTNRIVDYSKCIIVEKAVYGVILTAVLLMGYRSFSVIILADICGRLAALLYGCFLCREIVCSKCAAFRVAGTEIWENIKAGMPLLLANLAGMFVIGIVQFAIEMQWDIVSFGYIGLAITLCNFILAFLASIGQVLFPVLKRAQKSELPQTYKKMSCGIVLLIAAALVTYQPIKGLMDSWSPSYSSSMSYLALLFPMCIFEGKTNILLYTFFKVMRRERTLLIINVCAMLGSALLAGMSVFLLHDLTLSAISIVAACAFRCVACEMYLLKKMRLKDTKVIVMECVLAAGFIVINLVLTGVPAIVGYIILLCLAVMLCREDIIRILRGSR